MPSKRYEEEDSDVDHGGVENNIFDTVGLPDLPVDQHHHPLNAPRHAHDAEEAAAAAAAAASTAVGNAIDVTNGGYGAGGVTDGSDLPHGHGVDAYTQHQMQVPQGGSGVVRTVMPMPEAVIPPKWLARYEELKWLKKSYEDINEPLKTAKYKQLSAWVRTQKQQYKLLHLGKPNKMRQARVDLLNEIGFEWAEERREKFWHAKYNELVAFHAKNGTTRIPPLVAELQPLHTWVSLQRRMLKRHREGKPTKLTQERIRLLDALGLESHIRAKTTWMDRFMELKRYKDEHGDCNVPQKWKENPSLGRWVDNQKTQHKKLYDGKPTHMTIERIQLLVSIGFDWRRS
mmetsp:Transcript_11283/g.24068  ORF Transcript_11283/g.24068 Transcript_11283/m.24068 type:complete len:344 (-) Transcript_11283:618-1649(-)